MVKLASYKWLVMVPVAGIAVAMYGVTAMMWDFSHSFAVPKPFAAERPTVNPTAQLEPSAPREKSLASVVGDSTTHVSLQISKIGKQPPSTDDTKGEDFHDIKQQVTDPTDRRQRYYAIQQLGSTDLDAIATLAQTLKDPALENRHASVDSLSRIAARSGDPEGSIRTLLLNTTGDSDSALARHASAALLELSEREPRALPFSSAAAQRVPGI